MERQNILFKIVGALHTPRRFPSGLNRREKETDQNSDNRDNDEKFNESKTRFTYLQGKKTTQKTLAFNKAMKNYVEYLRDVIRSGNLSSKKRQDFGKKRNNVHTLMLQTVKSGVNKKV